MPNEKPIIFSTPMVKAILDGRKTMTRRVIKSHKKYGDPENWNDGDLIGDGDLNILGIENLSPYGKPGDELWVRESCVISSYLKDTGPWATFKDGCQKTKSGKYSETSISPKENWWKTQGHKLTPSIHTPRWVSRIQLKILDIRVERVRDITWQDVVKEGYRGDMPMVNGQEWFWRLWNSINKERGYGWDLNPFVWVVEFEIKK